MMEDCMITNRLVSFLTIFVLLSFGGCDTAADSGDQKNDFFNDQSEYPSSVNKEGVVYTLRVNQFNVEDTVEAGTSLPVDYIVTNTTKTKIIFEFTKVMKLQYTIRSSSGTLLVTSSEDYGDNHSTVEVDSSANTTFSMFRSLVDDNRKQLPAGIFTLRVRLDSPGAPILLKRFVIK